MSRLPIIHTAFVLLVMTAMLLPLISYGSDESILPQTQHGLISSIDQLRQDRALGPYRETYPALSGANVIYAQCGKEMDISDSEKDYLKAKFAQVTKGYVAAYQDAYVRATNAAPPQSFLNDVAKRLIKIQQDAVDGIALVIRQRGCGDGRLRSFVKYVDAMHKHDRRELSIKPAVQAQPYQ